MVMKEHLSGGVEEKASKSRLVINQRSTSLFPLALHCTTVLSLLFIWTAAGLVSQVRAVDGCRKGRNNRLGLYNGRNGWIGSQPDCYQFSYTYSTGVVSGEKQDFETSSSAPVVNRVAYSCAVDDTTATPPAEDSAPAPDGLRTITDFYDFATDRCVGPCSNDEEAAKELELPDCQITYKILVRNFRDPVFGFSLGVAEYEIPEQIIIPATTQEGTEQRAIVLQVSDFVNLDCEKEGMAREDMEDCSKDEFKWPEKKQPANNHPPTFVSLQSTP